MRSLVMVAGVLGLAQLAPAQQPPAAFEAASVKRNTSGETRMRFETPPGRLTAVNVPLRFAIRQAWRVPESRVIGGPSWIDTERFDITATAPGITSGNENRILLRRLMMERFALAIHTETREMPVYALTSAKDGRLGPNLRPSTTDCTGKSAAVAGPRVVCGILVSQSPVAASLRGGAATLTEFIRLFGDFVDRPVVDESGLTGTFDLELEFTTTPAATPGSDLTVVFTALQEQLGLRLEPKRAQVDVLVVDSVSPPTPD